MSKKQDFKVKIIAEYACFLALSMIVSYIETLLPVFIGIPGAKLGIANAVIVFALYRIGVKGAFCINLSRVLLCGLLFGNLYSMMYSLAGAMFSFIMMCLIRQIPAFGMVGVSISGGIMHNIAQLLLAVMITKVPLLLYYVPILIIVGAITGLLNGWIAQIIYKRTRKQIDE